MDNRGSLLLSCPGWEPYLFPLPQVLNLTFDSLLFFVLKAIRGPPDDLPHGSVAPRSSVATVGSGLPPSPPIGYKHAQASDLFLLVFVYVCVCVCVCVFHATGLYVEGKGARSALKKFADLDPHSASKDKDLFKVLGQAGGFSKYLHLIFARGVGAQRVVDAFTSVKDVDQEVLNMCVGLAGGGTARSGGRGGHVLGKGGGRGVHAYRVWSGFRPGTFTEKAYPSKKASCWSVNLAPREERRRSSCSCHRWAQQ